MALWGVRWALGRAWRGSEAMRIMEDVPIWHQVAAAMITQVGDVYRVVVPLPLKVGDRYLELVVYGSGVNAKVEVQLDVDRLKSHEGPPEPESA
jgi:hypothetical protein